MARFTRVQTLLKMQEIGVIPVFYNSDLEKAKGIINACANAGAHVLEFTNRGDFACEIFGQMEKYIRKEHPDMILGIGTIIDPYTAALYISNGTNFVVGPVLNEEVAKLCNRKKIPYSPGCGSVTEIQKAEELGCEIIKIFPAGEMGGPKFVKSIRGPMPWTSIMPTGGVSPDKESLKEWFDAGVACVGMGSKLIIKDLVENNDFKALEKNIKQVLTIIREIRKQ